MGIYDDDEDDDQQGQQDNNAMRQLRKALKAEQAKNKEFEVKLAELSKANRGRAIQDVLAEKGLTNPKIANLIPQDIDPTAEAVGQWLEEYGDVFGVGGTPAAEAGRPNIPDADLNALRDIDSVGINAKSLADHQNLLARIENAASPEELASLIAGMSGG